MSETAKTPEGEKKPKKTRLKHVVRLGSKAEYMELRAQEQKSGNFVAYAKHVIRGADGKRDRTKGGRGATTNHADFDSAKAAIAKLQTELQKAGWTLRAGGGGGAVKDTFDFKSLPKPPAPAKK